MESHWEAVRRKARDIRGLRRESSRQENGLGGKDLRQRYRQLTKAETETRVKPKSPGGALSPTIALEGRGYYRYKIAYAVPYSLGHRG
ncbi:hypothetical protein NDU88_003827 [Pleurodeles waltl]|uniref:Uncharacterized protein n=1 Tax=Pleurodeles waltl TaxID=8319 RepID=A0AAV7NHT2_PLEWA|nr:hypothetical protein NDU88_003827 [Pleurodeles waltl]